MRSHERDEEEGRGGGGLRVRPIRMRVVQRLGGGRGCHKFVPILVGDGTKIAPPGDLFDQPPGEMR